MTGRQSCTLGVDGYDPAERNYTSEEMMLLDMDDV